MAAGNAEERTDEQDRSQSHLQDLRPASRALAEGCPGGHEQGRPSGPQRPYAGSARHLPDHRRRQHLRHHGPVGFGQVHAHPALQPPHRAHLGRDPGGRPERGGAGAARPGPLPPAEDEHGLPAFRPLSAPNRAGQRRLRSGRAEGAARAARGKGTLLAGPGGAVGLRAPVPAPALRRDAAAGGAGPRAGHRCRDPPDGRGFLGTGSAHPPRDAGPPAEAAGTAQQDYRLHYPRPGRGVAPGQPHRHPEGRRAGPGRRARGHPAGAGHRVRAVLPAGREPQQGAQRRSCAAGGCAVDAHHAYPAEPCAGAASGAQVRLCARAGRQAAGWRAHRRAHH